MTTVRELVAASDAAWCDAVMASLPDFFALDSGLADCARAVRSERGAVDGLVFEKCPMVSEQVGGRSGSADWLDLSKCVESRCSDKWIPILVKRIPQECDVATKARRTGFV